MEIRGFGFPYELPVAVGTTVIWTNADAVGHDVTALDGSWASSILGQGASFSRTFTTAGRQAYYCELHPYMQAVVIVE